MDYALERHSGLLDLVEIESSSLELFTKDGNPRKELVHAEQQVFDWLEWMEANGSYVEFPTKSGYWVKDDGLTIHTLLGF